MYTENGLVSWAQGKLLEAKKISDQLGDDDLQKFINFVLRYLSDVTLPCKRGTFIEFRTGMLNISPVGRNCSQEERDAFEVYD